jgi:hypothetical protein
LIFFHPFSGFHMKRSWIRDLFVRPVSRPIRKLKERSKLVLEALEDRCVPATITVSTTADSGAGSLRAAITQANASVGVADTIVFSSLFNTPQTITLTSGQLTITDTATTTITGPGANLLSVSGNNVSRVVAINAGASAAFTGLKITGGFSTTSLKLLTGFSVGGGLANYGAVTLSNCTVSGNATSTKIINGATYFGFGGGLYNTGTASLTSCTVSGNSAPSGFGGGIYSKSGKLTLTNCTLSGNSAGQSGGGLFTTGTAALTSCTVSGNSSGSGAGMYSTGTATLTTCTLSANNASTYGGALVNGGIATLTICTLSGNSAGGGGGLLNKTSSTATLINCTVSGNSALGDQYHGTGGGLLNNGTASATNCTISANTCGYSGGGILNSGNERYANSSSALTLKNTIVAGNTVVAGNGDVNLINQNGGTFSGANNLIGGNPLLAPLGNYGGPTQTMALLPGSPAINTGTSGTGIPTTDERGLGRVGTTDIGAVESQGYTIAVVAGSTPQSAYAGLAFAKALGAKLTENVTNAPLPGATLTYTSPQSGAGLTATTQTANTDTTGIASLSATANGFGGSYTVTATDSGLAVSFSLQNIAVVSIAVSPSNPSVINGLTQQFSATGTYADASTHAITNSVTWTSATPSVAAIGSTGLASTTNAGTSVITAALGPVTSPADTLTVLPVPSYTFPVTNVNDSGPGSLRDEVGLADSTYGINTVTFDPTVFGTQPQTITLTTGELDLSTMAFGSFLIQGPGANLLTVSGNGASQVFGISSGTLASLSGLTISKGYGAGVSNLGTLTMTNCTVSGNSSTYGTAYGVDSAGALSLTNSTISGNSSTYGLTYGVRSFGYLSMSNCTVNGNSSSGSAFGVKNSVGTATLTNCTISGNRSTSGIAYGVSNQGTLTLRNTIVALNPGLTHFDVSGTVTGASFSNLIGDGRGISGITNGVNGNQIGTSASPINPQLRGLTSSGGPTPTMVPLPGSPAIDAGNNGLTGGVSTDQRGFTRIIGGAVDIGAVEFEQPTITGITIPVAGAEGTPVTLSATATEPDSALTYTWTITPPAGAGGVITRSGSPASFTPPDEGSYVISLTVRNSYGAATSLPPTGLVSSWRGEGNASDVNAVNTGALSGGVTYAAGKVGQAFQFDSTSTGQVQVPSAASLNLTTAVSLEAWVNPSTLSFAGGFGAVLVKGSGTSRNYGLFVTSTGGLQLSYFTTGGANVFLNTAAGRVPVGQFTHVAGVIDSVAGRMQIYVNGVLAATRTTGGPLVANTLPLTIGKSDGFAFQGLIDEASVYNRPLRQIEIQSIVNVGGLGKFPSVPVTNVPPTPALWGAVSGQPTFANGLPTELLSFTATATDPSTTDVAGFAYSINWGDGSLNSTSAAATGNGSGVGFTHVFTAAVTVPTSYTVALTATDEDGGANTVTQSITILPLTSANLQTVINQQGSITFLVASSTQTSNVVHVVDGLTAQAAPVTVTLNLGGGTYTTDTHVTAPTNLKFVVANGTLVGGSPALVVDSGDVELDNVMTSNTTNAPTIVVNGGHLALRNDDIEETSQGSQPALEINGGNVDLGAPDNPGGNTFNAHGLGELIHNSGQSAVPAVGNSFKADGVDITSPYRIKDKIFDALNAGGGGLVTYVPGSAFITVSSGSIQRGVDAIAQGGTVHVEAGSYKQYDAGSKLVTIAFENGPILSQQTDALNPSVRTLIVIGTPGNDKILFNPGDGAAGTVKVQVNDVAQGTFSPTGRLIAYGGAGDDNIQVASGIMLPAWLYGGDGNDRLKGGGGNNVLLGGSGDDVLIGGAGQNLLIGGEGADILNAGGEDDLLIAGTTAFDANELALSAIMAEWTSGRDYATRIANLSGTGSGPNNNGAIFLIASGPSATVFDDGAVDVLNGGAGMDWFFANLSQDKIHGRHASEIVVGL